MHHFFLFALFAAASAEVIYEGRCPDVKSKEDLDLSLYQGKWYQIARYPHLNEEGDKGKCTTIEYDMCGETGKVTNSHVVDGIRVSISGDMTLLAPGQVRLIYTFGGVTQYNDFNVLDTDYKSYSIIYKCKYFPDANKHQVFAWIKSRNTSLDCIGKSAVNDYLKVSKVLDVSKYVQNDYSDEACYTWGTRAITEFRKN